MAANHSNSPDQPTVSVVMPAYNVADTVGAAVESIRSQNYSDWEMVIVEDGSTDATYRRLRELTEGDRRFQVLRNDRNRGLAVSLNRGWRHATGHLIARMDADDKSLPGRLSAQVGFMHAHPTVSVLGGFVELVDDLGRPLGIGRRPERHHTLSTNMYREVPFMHPTVMMRRDFLTALDGYDEHLRRGEDVDLWIRGYRDFRYHNLQQPLVTYTVPRPSWETIIWNSYTLARAARRDGLLWSHGWYSARFFIATLLAKAGLRRNRLG